MLKAGDLELKSEEFTIPVSEEVLVGSATVGTPDDAHLTNRAGEAPFNYYYNNSCSETVYPQEFLAKYGITPGTVIDGITLNGWSSQSAKDIACDITVKMTTVEQSTLTKDDPEFDLSDIEPLYTASSISLPGGISSSETKPMAVFKFTRPFKYEGGNLLVQCKSENGKGYRQTYFDYSLELTSNTRYKRNDNYNTYTNASWSTLSNIPVM